MKHFFYRAKFLIIIYSLVAMLLSLGSMAYVKHLNDYKAFEQLSSDYVVGNITCAEDGSDLRGALLQAAGKCSESFLLAADFTGVRAFAVYYTEASCFPLRLTEGRLFDEEDFQEKKNVALVSLSTRERCVDKGGRIWWDYGGTLFEVVGVYEDTDSFGDRTPDCYLNLTAQTLDTSIFCSFIFDAGTDTADDFDAIKNEITGWSDAWYIDGAGIQTDKAKEFLVSGNNFNAMFIMLILTALLVLFNSVSAVYNWLYARRREIALRRFCGASVKSVTLWIAGNLVVLILLSFAVGVVLSSCFLHVGLATAAESSVQMMFGLRLQWKHILLSFSAVLILCGFVASVPVYRFQKREIAGEIV